MRLHKFALYSWGVLAYNLLVIMWGAYVRATGSGAGCGSHWPLCNGEVIPNAPHIKTVIEFTHRLSSGLALILVVVLLVWAFRAYARGHVVRKGAALSMFFILTEALIGAGLVLFELVAENRSMARALSMSAHLINTFLLIGVLALTAWWASGGASIEFKERKPMALTLAVSLLGVLILGISGAVAALGDTLFPATSLQQALQQDLSPTAHILIRLRLLHPIIALVSVALALAAAIYGQLKYPAPWTLRLCCTFMALAVLQLGLGLLNVYLLAPVWLQLVHLLVADIMWISQVLLTGSILSGTESTERGTERTEIWKKFAGSSV